MRKIVASLPFTEATLVLLLFASGCKTVVRENIISSINTGIGVSLAENPKTELYEAKVGYIRSQFYSVPTGKLVEKDKHAEKGEQKYSNDAQKTPNVVSGIRFNSDLRHLMLGATISENFAVGDLAVNSRAAIAMYIADAPNTNNAAAAAQAVKQLNLEPIQDFASDNSTERLEKWLEADTSNSKKLDDWMKIHGLNPDHQALLIYGKSATEARKKAVQDLSVP